MSEADDSPQYRIEVRGWLEADWSEWFEGMAVQTGHDDGGGLITVISGPVRDQAALQGILTKVWNLNLPVLVVTCLAGSPVASKRGPAPLSWAAWERLATGAIGCLDPLW